MLRSPILRRLLIAAVCSLAILPFLWLGNPSGHDFEFHVYSWMDALAQWRQGVVYPRWAAFPHWGYGEARFVFYPPISWMLGAALGSVLPWKLVPGLYCWFALTLASAAMYRLAGQWLRPADAVFAAVFYALNPYHLLAVYWRSAYAELLCAALLPLLLLFVVRLNEGTWRPTLGMSLVLAGAWLTNAPAAIMIHYSAAGLALLVAVRERSARPLWRLALAVLLAAGLASIYLVPAIFEERWVNLAQGLSPGVRPQDNFLFTATADPDHNHFNRLVSFVAAAEITVLAGAIVFSRRERSNNVWTPLAVWGAGAAFAMFSISNVLWRYLPRFQFVQLPFRWLLCMNIAVALLLVMATARSTIKHWIMRGLVCAMLLAVVIYGGRRTQPPWWVTGADIEEMRQSVVDGTGNEGVDEYVPAAADPYEVNKDLPCLSFQTGADAATRIDDVKILAWTATEKHFQASANGATNLTVRLFNYPAWKATVNGREVATTTSEVTGLMIVPIAAGENDVEIRFAGTPDRWLGDSLSLLSMVVLLFAWARTRPKTVSRTAK